MSPEARSKLSLSDLQTHEAAAVHAAEEKRTPIFIFIREEKGE